MLVKLYVECLWPSTSSTVNNLESVLRENGSSLSHAETMKIYGIHFSCCINITKDLHISKLKPRIMHV